VGRCWGGFELPSLSPTMSGEEFGANLDCGIDLWRRSIIVESNGALIALADRHEPGIKAIKPDAESRGVRAVLRGAVIVAPGAETAVLNLILRRLVGLLGGQPPTIWPQDRVVNQRPCLPRVRTSRHRARRAGRRARGERVLRRFGLFFSAHSAPRPACSASKAVSRPNATIASSASALAASPLPYGSDHKTPAARSQ
jgi:hypothetical protein